MTLQVTGNIRLFVQRMTESDEQAQWGFSLLLKRDDYEEFFDLLHEAGLFSPAHNPLPVPGDEPGFVRIPFWSALTYLTAVAKNAGEENDAVLAEKVMAVIRDVSNAREEDGSVRDNHHTFWAFAEILGHLPAASISVDDLGLIPGWLSSRYESGGQVGHALDTGVLQKFLDSDQPEDAEKACKVLWHCTAFRWANEKGYGRLKKPVPVVDEYWLKELIQRHATRLGEKLGKRAADVLLTRVRELFGEGGREEASWSWRPAIEDHEQNYSWDGAANLFVEGLRDVLLAWINADVASAKQFVLDLLTDKAEIARRMGIYVLNQRWDLLNDLYLIVLNVDLFDQGHLHELYGLLKNRFQLFSAPVQEATVNTIRQIPSPDPEDALDQLLRLKQRTWLSAIVGKGCADADNWFDELSDIGKMDEHPDFHVYMTSSSGPGSSPYTVNELISYAEDGSIVERLNAFEQKDSWHGPTTRALVDMLVEAIKVKPLPFLLGLQQFLHAKRAYQYGVISGFKHVWESSPGSQAQLDWPNAWNSLVLFFGALIEDKHFWDEQVEPDKDFTPDRNWIPPIIAEFLRAGTRDDSKAYEEELLPRTWRLVLDLLDNLEPVAEAREDAMTQAINTSRGKAIEALFSHALRECRVSDKSQQGHAEAWTRMQPVFDRELERCKASNYEFSTLAAAYTANLFYMDSNWLLNNIERIFPEGFPDNFACAMEGLAYAPATRPIYSALRDKGVVEWALKNSPRGRHAREKLIERMALAYLWGEEDLVSPRFTWLFENGSEDDLIEVSNFLWSINRQNLEPDQIERIFQFWEKCLGWCGNAGEVPSALLSSLSRLSVYIQALGEREKVLLETVAPYANTHYNVDRFLEELDRLVDIDPAVISGVFQKVIESYKPTYDFRDRLKSLIRSLSDHGLREPALRFANNLRHLEGMPALFEELSSPHGDAV